MDRLLLSKIRFHFFPWFKKKRKKVVFVGGKRKKKCSWNGVSCSRNDLNLQIASVLFGEHWSFGGCQALLPHSPSPFLSSAASRIPFLLIVLRKEESLVSPDMDLEVLGMSFCGIWIENSWKSGFSIFWTDRSVVNWLFVVLITLTYWNSLWGQKLDRFTHFFLPCCLKIS